MDWELLVWFSCVVSAIVGVLCGVLAGYYYVRFDRKTSDGVLVSIVALLVQSALVIALPKARYEALLPLVFVFLIIASSVIMVWVGLKAHSKAGSRIALSGLFSAYAYMLALGTNYYGFVNRGFWRLVTISLFR